MVEISNGDIVRVDGVVREVKWLEITGVRDVSGRIQSVEPWYKGKVKLEAGGGEFRNLAQASCGMQRVAEHCKVRGSRLVWRRRSCIQPARRSDWFYAATLLYSTCAWEFMFSSLVTHGMIPRCGGTHRRTAASA